MLKIKIGSSKESLQSEDGKHENIDGGECSSTSLPSQDVHDSTSEDGGVEKSVLTRALDNHVRLDRFDAMIEKAENAQYSMMHQSKQMKSVLK